MTAVGFIGLGIMGSPMAANLVKAGHKVTGFDVSEDRRKQLTEAGGTAANTVAEAVADAEVVITMLPNHPQVEQVVLGEDGVLANAKPGATLVDMSTIRPETSLEVANVGKEKGVKVLDAPVSGGEAGAINAALSIMVGGEQADFDTVKPLLDALGKTVVLVGPHSAGQVVKAANQLVVGGIYSLVSEAIVLLEASGVDAKQGLDVLAGGLAGSKILELKRESMVNREFKPGFRIDLHHKDMGIILDAARQVDVSLPFGALISQYVQAARSMGHGDLDHSGLLKVSETLSGNEK